jgi:hypothetical protein
MPAPFNGIKSICRCYSHTHTLSFSLSLSLSRTHKHTHNTHGIDKDGLGAGGRDGEFAGSDAGSAARPGGLFRSHLPTDTPERLLSQVPRHDVDVGGDAGAVRVFLRCYLCFHPLALCRRLQVPSISPPPPPSSPFPPHTLSQDALGFGGLQVCACCHVT